MAFLKKILDYFWTKKECEENDDDIEIHIKGNDDIDDFRNLKQIMKYYDVNYKTTEDDEFSVHVEEFNTKNPYTIYFLIGRITRTLPSKNILNALKITSYLNEINHIDTCIKHSNNFPKEDTDNFLNYMENELEENAFLGNFDNITIADYCMYFFITKISHMIDIDKFENVYGHFQNIKFILEFDEKKYEPQDNVRQDDATQNDITENSTTQNDVTQDDLTNVNFKKTF